MIQNMEFLQATILIVENVDLPKRKQNRLIGYDYSQNGAYFLTICVKDRQELLWNVGATFGRPYQSPQLSKYGLIIENEIDHIDKIYDNNVVIDKYVIMSNHIHMIVLLQGNNGHLLFDDGQPLFDDGQPLFDDGQPLFDDGQPLFDDRRPLFDDGQPLFDDGQPLFDDGRPLFDDGRPLFDDGRPKVAPTISRVIKQFKGSVTKQIGFSLWQKSFHDHIIRNEQEYQKIWEYIEMNPQKWEDDCFYNH